MVGGGLMQLVAYGVQDVHLTRNSEVDFHRAVYQPFVNFATESIEQTFNGPGLREENIPEEETFDMKFDRLHTVHGTLREECSICLDKPPGMITRTGCGHEFHTECIKGWLRDNPSCPLCRSGFG